jgi:hypothetical protein
MYVYFIIPSEKLKPNFIKIGFSNDFNSLKKRYSTYYGFNHISYHVKVNDKTQEIDIHNELKDNKLHIENELFVYDDNYNYEFYKDKLDELLKKSKKIKESEIDKYNAKLIETPIYENIDIDKKENIIEYKCDEYDITKDIDKLTISENVLSEEINKENRSIVKNNKKNNEEYYNLEKAKRYFEESVNNKYINKKKKFRQRAKKCNSFIKLLDEIYKKCKDDNIKIQFTELSPKYFQELDNNVFVSFINYIKNKYNIC